MEDRVMKAKIYTLAISFLLLAGKAFGNSELTITNLEGSSFYVIFDGEVIDPNSSVLFMVDVRPGNRSLDIYRTIRDARGYPTRYVELVYRGSFFIDNRMSIVTNLTADGRLLVVRKTPITPPAPAKPGKGSGYNSHGSGKGNSGYNNHGSNAAPVMNTHEFSGLMKMVRDASFEQTKLTIAKEGFAFKSPTADMVYQIMNLFSFEATKLEFAKWAYMRTFDRHNYYLVNRAFSFDASIRELSAYINNN
jgi:hypothetical protein